MTDRPFEPDLYGDALARYHDAMERRQEILVAWDEENRDLTAEGSAGQMQEHPLLKMLREHDVLCQRLAADLKKAHRGPQPSAVPSIRSPKSSRLRSVG